MMNVEDLRSYCLSLDSDVVEKFPFTAFKYAKDVLVFYISGHMFCYFDINDLSNVTVKCDPDSIPELEDHYDWISKPYNGNAKYWIGMDAYRADNELFKQLIRKSYEIVKKGNKTKKRKMNVFEMKFAKVFPMLIAKAERKGRTREEVYELTEWLTGYSNDELDHLLNSDTTYGEFFDRAPQMNPACMNFKGRICGVRIEEIEDPKMRDMRVLDKLVDELVKGKPVEKILNL